MSTGKCMQCQHAARVDRQRFSCLANRLIDKRSIRLVLSLPRMGPRPKGDFVGTEIVGAASSGLRLLRRLDLWRDRGHDGSASPPPAPRRCLPARGRSAPPRCDCRSACRSTGRSHEFDSTTCGCCPPARSGRRVPGRPAGCRATCPCRRMTSCGRSRRASGSATAR